MANLEIEGKLVRKLAVQSGRTARGDWQKQDFIVEFQEGNFPSSACFNVWGADKVKELEKIQQGSEVKVAFNISSREYNGRWYTDLRAWRITPAGQPQQTASQPYDVPAGFAPRQTPPPPGAADVPADFSDDLPF